ncbi:hypothetical protein D9M68_913260 [compost metagenome]
MIEQILTLCLADLIGGAQGVGFQQVIAMCKQGLALVLGLVQALQFGQVTGLFGTAYSRSRLAGKNRAGNQTPAQQQGRY